MIKKIVIMIGFAIGLSVITLTYMYEPVDVSEQSIADINVDNVLTEPDKEDATNSNTQKNNSNFSCSENVCSGQVHPDTFFREYS